MTIQPARPIALLIAVLAAPLGIVVSSAAVAPASAQGVVKSSGRTGLGGFCLFVESRDAPDHGDQPG